VNKRSGKSIVKTLIQSEPSICGIGGNHRESSTFWPSRLTQVSVFSLVFGEVQGLIRTVHRFGTRVRDPKKVGDRHIGGSVDAKDLHFRIANPETPKGGRSHSGGPAVSTSESQDSMSRESRGHMHF
jgi:hypothetical protein